MKPEPIPHDSHVAHAHKLMRQSGFTLHALQFPRRPRELAALCALNGLADPAKAPVGWRYFPNAGMKAWWERQSDAEITASIAKARG